MTVCSFAVDILCMGFGAGLGTKWEADKFGNRHSAINRDAIYGGGDSFDFRGEALVMIYYPNSEVNPTLSQNETGKFVG